MTLKKITSMLLALTMVLGLLGSGIFAHHADAAEPETKLHISDAITYDADNGKPFFLYADVVEDGAAKSLVYIVGNVGQTYGDNTAGLYSLATAGYPDKSGTQLTMFVKKQYFEELGQNCFFLKTGTSGSSSTFLYAFDYGTDGDWDTGSSTSKTDYWQNTFTWDAVNGQVHQKVPTATADVYDDYVLVCSKLKAGTNGDLWRMYFKSVNDVDTTMDYYVKLGQDVACTFGTEWKSDGVNHWYECSCGARDNEQAHNTEGAQWKTDDSQHWKVCNDCGAIVTATLENHTWGSWTYGTDTQTRTCEICQYEQTTAKHECTAAADAPYESDGMNHWKLCEECKQPVPSTIAPHTPKEGLVQDPANTDHADEHWQICSVCDAPYGYAKHSFAGEYSSDESSHWQTCACGATNPADHTWGDWAADSTPGSVKRTCSVCQKSQQMKVLDEGIYDLNATVDDVKQFFIKSSSTNLNGTHSLKTTNHQTESTQITVTRKYDEASGEFVYYLSYEEDDEGGKKIWYLYAADKLTGRTLNAEYAHIDFRWDAEKDVLYRTLGGVKYVLSFVQMPKNDTETELRIYALPEGDMASRGAVAAKLNKTHAHTFEGEYFSDENGHWQKCACGLESEHIPHEIAKWTVDTEPTETTAGSKVGVCSVCNQRLFQEIPPRVKDGNYYLTGVVGGVPMYFRVTGTGESVTQTLPYSLCTTDDRAAATLVAITLDEETNRYTISYFNNKILYLYINDEKINGELDHIIDTGVTGSQSEARTPFCWDPESKVLYQTEGDVKYVLAFKTMTNTKTNAQEVRLVGVPVTELSDSIVAAKLELVHEHKYGESWESDAVGHWHECACGAKKDEADHTVSEWTVEKEATETEAGSKTGKCDVCGAAVKATIPATALVIEPPKDGDVKYLSATVNGVRYFFRHTTSGESVTSTTPYSLYTTNKVSAANAITVRAVDGGYTLNYSVGQKSYRLYINASGVGVTAKEDAALVNFSWDEENHVLYQVEGDVKYVLVFKPMDNAKTGAKELRITAMPLRDALSDSSVYLVELTADAPAQTGDPSVIGMMAVVMALSACAMGALAATRKKWF